MFNAIYEYASRHSGRMYDYVVMPFKKYCKKSSDLKKDAWKMFAFFPKDGIVILNKQIDEKIMQVSALGQDNMNRMWNKKRGIKEPVKRDWWNDRIE